MLSVLVFKETDFVVYLFQLILDRCCFINGLVNFGLSGPLLIFSLLKDVFLMMDSSTRRFNLSVHALDLVTRRFI